MGESSDIRLFLRGLSSASGQEIEIPLDNPDATVFSYLQTLVLHGVTGPNINDKLRKVWEPIYTSATFTIHFFSSACFTENFFLYNCFCYL